MQKPWFVQRLDLYRSVVAAFPTFHLSSVIVFSFMWYLYINYTSFTLLCRRICAAFCPSISYGVFFLVFSAFSVPPFLMLLICSVWASLSYFILDCFFFSSLCTFQDTASRPAMSLLLSILRFTWGPDFRSFCLLVFLFVILQVNGHFLCVLICWMYFVYQGYFPD